MRTTIHNRRGTNHLIDPRFRSELLHSKEVAAHVEIQALSTRVTIDQKTFFVVQISCWVRGRLINWKIRKLF